MSTSKLIPALKMVSQLNERELSVVIGLYSIFISVVWYSAEKSGVLPEDTVPLSKFVIEECHHLKFCGLMTIGKYGYDTSLGLNPDFIVRWDLFHFGKFYVGTERPRYAVVSANNLSSIRDNI